jgi:hypothetical protein
VSYCLSADVWIDIETVKYVRQIRDRYEAYVRLTGANTNTAEAGNP